MSLLYFIGDGQQNGWLEYADGPHEGMAVAFKTREEAEQFIMDNNLGATHFVFTCPIDDIINRMTRH